MSTAPMRPFNAPERMAHPLFGFRRKENREQHNDDEEKTEAELPENYQSRVLLLGSCSSSIQKADVHVKDVVGRIGEKEKEATSEKISLSDPQLRTRAEPMTGSSSNSMSSVILGFESRRVHTELYGEESDSNLLEQELKLLEEVHIGAPWLPTGTALGDFENFEAEGTNSKIMDQHHDKLPGCSGMARRGSSSGFGKRKLKGDETESEFSGQDYARVTSLNRSPIFGFWRKAHERLDGEEVECELLNGQEKNGTSAGASSAIIFRGKQLCKGKGESSPSRLDTKAISLPHELVEKIIAMMPFPGILKTRALNKSWNTNFSASPDGLVFQKQVGAVSAKWKHYCPIILNTEEEWLVGYDREYNRWQNVPLGMEREALSDWFSTQKLRGAGSLMCGVFNRIDVFITNIVTRTWKWLPSRPDMSYPKIIHLLPIGSDAYQVLLISKNDRYPTTEVSCQLYDSRMKSWTIRRSTVSSSLSNSSSVYLNGVLYVMEYDPDDFHDVMKMLSYNVSDGTWANIHHPFGSMLHEIETYELLLCQNHVMVVLHVRPTWWTTNRCHNNSSHNTLRNTLMVYKLDPDSLDIKEVARGPPEPMFATCALFASDNECIYFGDPQVASSSIVELNVQNREWSCIRAPKCAADGSFKNKWATFAFQPGMNPFVSV